jgi:hypothetical protein
VSSKERCTPEQNDLFEHWYKIAIGLSYLSQFEPENEEYLNGKRSAYMWDAKLVVFFTREESLEKSRQEIERCRTYPGRSQMLLTKADTLERVTIPTMHSIPWNDPRR